MRGYRGAVFAALMALPSVATADELHFETIRFGQEAMGMAGAISSFTRTAEASFYNPGGLAFMDGFTISGGLQFYGVDDRIIPEGFKTGGLAPSERLQSREFLALPSSAVLTYRLNPNHVIAYSTYLTIDDRASFPGEVFVPGEGAGDEGRTGTMYRFNDDRLFLMGPSYAYKPTDSFGVGASVFYARRDTTIFHSYGLEESAGDDEEDVGRQESAQIRARDNGILGKLGLQWRPDDHWTVGLVTTTRSYPLDGEAQVFAARTSENSADAAALEAESRTVTPWSFTSGLGYGQRGKWRVGADVSLHLPTKYRRVDVSLAEDEGLLRSLGKIYKNRLETEAVVNYRLGTQWHWGKTTMLRAGYYTNFSAAPEVPAFPTEPVAPHIDFHGVTSSVAYESGGKGFTVGVDVQWGRGHDIVFRNAVDRETSRIDRVPHNLLRASIFFSGAFGFLQEELEEKAGEFVDADTMSSYRKAKSVYFDIMGTYRSLKTTYETAMTAYRKASTSAQNLADGGGTEALLELLEVSTTELENLAAEKLIDARLAPESIAKASRQVQLKLMLAKERINAEAERLLGVVSRTAVAAAAYRAKAFAPTLFAAAEGHLAAAKSFAVKGKLGSALKTAQLALLTFQRAATKATPLLRAELERRVISELQMEVLPPLQGLADQYGALISLGENGPALVASDLFRVRANALKGKGKALLAHAQDAAKAEVEAQLAEAQMAAQAQAAGLVAQARAAEAEGRALAAAALAGVQNEANGVRAEAEAALADAKARLAEAEAAAKAEGEPVVAQTQELQTEVQGLMARAQEIQAQSLVQVADAKKKGAAELAALTAQLAAARAQGDALIATADAAARAEVAALVSQVGGLVSGKAKALIAGAATLSRAMPVFTIVVKSDATAREVKKKMGDDLAAIRTQAVKALLMDAGLSAARIRTVTEGTPTPQATGKRKRKARSKRARVTIGFQLMSANKAVRALIEERMPAPMLARIDAMNEKVERDLKARPAVKTLEGVPARGPESVPLPVDSGPAKTP